MTDLSKFEDNHHDAQEYLVKKFFNDSSPIGVPQPMEELPKEEEEEED